MAKQVVLAANVRDGLGKEKAKKLRAQGLIPAEFYGKGAENIHLTVDYREFEKAVKGSEAKYNSIFELTIKDVAGKESKELVLLREHQRDYLYEKITHIDFLRIDKTHPISVKVGIRLIGEAPAIKMGFILRQVLQEASIKCLPLEIPSFIDVDVSTLENAHDAIRVSDLKIPGVTIELPAGQEIVHAEVPREMKVEDAAATTASAADVPATAQKAPEAGAAAPAKDAKAPAAKPEAKK